VSLSGHWSWFLASGGHLWAWLRASTYLVLCFVGAIVSHVRVGDVKGMGPAAFMLTVSVAALALRILTQKLGKAG
jgi:hypothetical protein